MLDVPTHRVLREAHAKLEEWIHEALTVDEWLRLPAVRVEWHDVEGVPQACLTIATDPPTVAAYNTPEDRRRAHGMLHLLGTLPSSLSHHAGEVLGALDGSDCSTGMIVDALLDRALQTPDDIRRFLDDMVLPSITHSCAYRQAEAVDIGLRVRLSHRQGAPPEMWRCQISARDEATETWGAGLVLTVQRPHEGGRLRVDATVMLAGPATLWGRWARWRAGRRCRHTMAVRMDGILDTHRIVSGWWDGVMPLLRAQGAPPALGLR